MIPVEQIIMGGDTTLRDADRGDCLRACIASIFELDRADVPHFVAYEDWWEQWNAWTEDRGFVLRTAWHSVDENDPTKLSGYPGDIYWLANVLSPRIVRDDGTPGWHSVVMFGRELVWDPHPKRDMGHLGFTGIGYMFAVPDPARLVLLRVPERNDEPLPEDLERLLRDPNIVIPQDAAVFDFAADCIRANPDRKVPSGAFLHLYAAYRQLRDERERDAA